jgi:hypothetical protein
VHVGRLLGGSEPVHHFILQNKSWPSSWSHDYTTAISSIMQ